MSRAALSIGIVLLLGVGPTRAEEAHEETAEPDRTEVSAAAAEAEPSASTPVYVPPSRGAAKARVGGATRGAGDLPDVLVLAPDHVGRTTRAQPVLYWYLGQPTATRIDFTLVDASGVEPLVEATLEGPLESGIHAVPLADHDASLERGTTYQWYVALISDPERRSADVITGGAIERVDAPAALRTDLAADPSRSTELYAGNALWYDAVHAVSAGIEAEPGRPELRQLRARLLEDAGLTAIASWDRRASAEAPEPTGYVPPAPDGLAPAVRVGGATRGIEADEGSPRRAEP